METSFQALQQWVAASPQDRRVSINCNIDCYCQWEVVLEFAPDERVFQVSSDLGKAIADALQRIR